jgi:hypothetical protein
LREIWLEQQTETKRSTRQESLLKKAYDDSLEKALIYSAENDIDISDKNGKIDWNKFNEAKDKRQEELEQEQTNSHRMTL